MRGGFQADGSPFPLSSVSLRALGGGHSIIPARRKRTRTSVRVLFGFDDSNAFTWPQVASPDTCAATVSTRNATGRFGS